MAQNGLNIGLYRPNFVSPLSELVLQSELPRGYKISKFTKFAEDTSESIVEHIARYLTKAGDLENDENLRLKFFPNSLTKNAFTWFTTLAPHSIQHWTELETLFHEQFYMGQSKISLKELASVKRSSIESIDDYLNIFRLLKARCFTQVPEHELDEMAAGDLDYTIRKKLDLQNLRDMAKFVTARFSLDLFCYLFICVYMYLYVINFLCVYFVLGLMDFGVEGYYGHFRLRGTLVFL